MAPSAQISLLGPPEIYQAPASSAATAPSGSLEISQRPASSVATATTTSGVSDPFVDLLVAKFNDAVAVSESPLMGLTENLSPTFLTTGNPCLDFFFHVVPDTPPETLIQRLELAWEQDPLKALKLVCNLRGVRGTGKSDKEGGYTAALWLHENHPKTLARNVESLANFGYSKDLLEILYRLLEGPDARKQAKEAYEQWKEMKKRKEKRKRIKEMEKLYGRAYCRSRRSFGAKRSSSKPKKDKSSSKPKKDKKSEPKLSREEKRILRAKRVVERFNSDPNFKCLHNSVSDYFARSLRSDMEMLNSGRPNKISLAAKWCPSLNSSYDNFTLLCETIARKVFPRDEYPEYEGVEEAHYAYRVRDRLRKQVLVPLRKALELPEVYIGANDWASLPYNRVASVAMKTYKHLFRKHDGDRFWEYLDKVKKGEAKIAAGALLPHQIIAPLFVYSHYMNWSLNDYEVGYDDEEEEKVALEVAELQWRRMVDDMAKIGKLNNCLAVCDVSGSMNGVPMEVSVALGVLVSELSDEPWKGKLITFSENPQLETVKGSSLIEKVAFVQGMKWGMNTDFQKVYDLMLQVAVSGKLKPDQMIKRLFVFSDMEFDQASMNPWETDYQSIVRKFKKKGFGESVPEIVFWNLRDSRATPVLGNQPGVALVSGYSKNLMKLFLEGGGIVNPVEVMEAAIARKEYQKLVVMD